MEGFKDDLGDAYRPGLAGAEAPEPHSRLGPSGGIPIAGELEKAHRLAGTMLQAQHEQERRLVLLEQTNAELLTAIEDFDNWFCGFDPDKRSSRMEGRQIIIRARAAIAKARGKS